MNFSALIKDCIPPILLRAMRKIRGAESCCAGNYASWQDASEHCTGYDAQAILDKVLAATLKVKNGEAVFERDSVLFESVEYSWPVLASLMWVAAKNKGQLNVLDFGGSLGSSYFQNRQFFEPLAAVRWGIVEQAHYVLAGTEYLQNEHLRFYSSIASCVEEGVPNVVLLSSVLQYLSDPELILQQILQIAPECIVIDRTPYVNAGSSVIKIQTVPPSIYHATYPCRFFVENEMVNQLTMAGYNLISTFPALDKLDPSATWKGHIFHREQKYAR